LTPTAMTTATLMIRPPSRIFWVSASIPAVGVGVRVEGPVAEVTHHLVELGSHPAHLRLGQRLDPSVFTSPSTRRVLAPRM
jgi:hypothetical protein